MKKLSQGSITDSLYHKSFDKIIIYYISILWTAAVKNGELWSLF